MVDSADTKIELRVVQPNESTNAVVDGRIMIGIQAGDRIVVERADLSFQMLSVKGEDDYRALREKLGWGGSVPLERAPDR